MKTIYIEDIKKINEKKAKKIAKKLDRINKKEEIVVALSQNLKEYKELNEAIESYGIKILDGRWIFKFLLIDILEYISKHEEKILEIQNIAILINNADEIIIKQIENIARRVKILKIITSKPYIFSYIERQLYNKYGIAIQIGNNKRKSLLDTGIIINFDFCEEKINEYNINNKAIIVNIQKQIKLNKSDFQGKNINNFKIQYTNDLPKNSNQKMFDENVMYESYIYRKDTFENIKKQLEEDCVTLIKLI